MARSPESGQGSFRYALGFSLTAVLLGGMTLFLVLVVLPRRYLLSAGLRESGISFPSEVAPFSPPEEVHREAPPQPPPPPEVIRGPAEVFWGDVGSLLEEGNFSQTFPLFEEYLREHPEDRGVRREFAITLTRAGRNAEAARIFQDLLAREEDQALRLLLARTLRDLGRLEEASGQYFLLVAHDPDDSSLALEWGRALAWGKEYESAAKVLSASWSRNPESVEVGLELARVYYWSGHLDEAEKVLAGMDQEAIQWAGGGPLRDELVAALSTTEPEEETTQGTSDPPPLSTLDRAAQAVAGGDYPGAALLFEEALREDPDNTEARMAYGNLLQYQLEDLEGARKALHRIEGLDDSDLPFRFRLAQLDLWTGRNDDARVRLEDLLEDLEREPSYRSDPDSARFGSGETAEVMALLGDLHRWEGERTLSGQRYELALRTDSTNQRARAGLDELVAETDRDIEATERPGLGGNAYSLADSDEFTRVDLGVGGTGVGGNWIWAMRTGTRRLHGLALNGAKATEQGLFLELESARWWGWGSFRSGLHLGVEELLPGQGDLTFGASLLFRDLAGFNTSVRFDHGPAYPLTVTLQSVFAEVVQDRMTTTLARRIAHRWSVSIAGDAAWISSNGSGEADPRASLRVEGGMSLGRSMTDFLTLGVNARALTYSNAAPISHGTRLFWDPTGVVAGGVFAQWAHNVRERWTLTAAFNPSLAFVDERLREGYETVPHLSAEAGVSHLGHRFRTDLNAFYYQGRFDGYRAYGLRFSFSARNWFRRESPS